MVMKVTKTVPQPPSRRRLSDRWTLEIPQPAQVDILSDETERILQEAIDDEVITGLMHHQGWYRVRCPDDYWSDDVKPWLEENCHGPYVQTHWSAFFRDEQDYVAFRLVWG